MIEYIGNCSDVINWDEVIAGLEKNKYEKHPGDFCVPENRPHLYEIVNAWKFAGYKPVEEGGSVQWDMFLPDIHFDQSVVEKFVNYFNIKNYSTAWISRIMPGNVSPIHWDVTQNDFPLEMPDNNLSNLKNKKIKDTLLNLDRWHAHIGKPTFGHVFVVDETCLHKQPQGATYKWSDRRLWHAGTNIGLMPKYQFNLL